MYVALYVLCGFYIYHRDPRIINDLSRLATLLVLVVVTVSLMVIASRDDWRAEMVPLMLFGMTVAIAYEQEIALLLSAAVTLIGVVAIGHGLGAAIVLLAATAGAILLLGRVRSRSKLLSVGFLAAGVAVLTTLGVGTMEGQPLMPCDEDRADVWPVGGDRRFADDVPAADGRKNLQRADRPEPDRAGRPGSSAACKN